MTKQKNWKGNSGNKTRVYRRIKSLIVQDWHSSNELEQGSVRTEVGQEAGDIAAQVVFKRQDIEDIEADERWKSISPETRQRIQAHYRAVLKH
jgi:hypothetical protein